MVVRTCSRCGSTAEVPDDGLPQGWSLEVARGGVAFLCLTCARDNIRAIEGKLPEEYW